MVWGTRIRAPTLSISIDEWSRAWQTLRKWLSKKSFASSVHVHVIKANGDCIEPSSNRMSLTLTPARQIALILVHTIDHLDPFATFASCKRTEAAYAWPALSGKDGNLELYEAANLERQPDSDALRFRGAGVLTGACHLKEKSAHCIRATFQACPNFPISLGI